MMSPLPDSGKLALFHGPGTALEIKSYPVSPLERGELLVKNVYTTLCGSDLHTYCGLRNEPCPTVLGHEIVGRIVAIHPDHSATDLTGQPIWPGDLITWTVFASDPQSINAQRGIPQKGDQLFKYGHVRVQEPEVFHGGLAEYCVLKPHTGIIRLPETMPVAIAATLNCSVATVAGALRMAGDLTNKTILITGMGHLGITCAAMCREAGASWIAAADITDQRLQQAQRFGADALFDMKIPAADLHTALQQHTNGRGVDVVFDMSGSPDAMEFGLHALGIGGVAVWVGAVFNTRRLQIDPEQIIRKLITIKGIHNYNFTDFRYAYDFLQQHWSTYPFSEVVEKEFPLEVVNEAFTYAVSRKPLRVGIRLE
ncbi:zinc-binding dehydrogenase [Paraflavitalea sp. CAU 1676]|uniref:zinc-binding dehydrogenase n=1 Tax=Paraflavitalea sp. CAU 1676 TaxID=3032598 RepID=UPI0023DC226D|nr:zinc-binding dehydrogenase [Paraflavitalea sp. CAU 1676]MDF2190632.1 zinc-binding dehydrogenase [Paraflavitalea sp. CAU 1676]